MRLRVMAVSWLLATAACAGISAPLESTPSFEPGHAMHDSFQLLQGMTLDRGGSRLAFQGGDGRGGAKVDVWDAQESVWQAHWRLAPGQLFAAGGGVLRVEGVEPGARATLHLAPASDSGGIPAPAPAQPVVSMDGSLGIAQPRIRLLANPTECSTTKRM